MRTLTALLGADDLPVLEPVAAFGGRMMELEQVTIAPRGDMAWFTARTRAIDLYRLNEDVGTSVVFALLVIVLATLAIIGVRVLQKPRIVGHRHCRRCNFDVEGLVAKICPECGCDLAKRRPVLGRSRARRFGVPALVTLLIALPCFFGGTPADLGERVCRLLQVRYLAVSDDWAKKWDEVLGSEVVTGAMGLYRTGLAGTGPGGETPRIVAVRSGMYMPVPVSSDGEMVAIRTRAGRGVGVYNARSGRTVKLPDEKLWNAEKLYEQFPIGFTHDNRGVFIQWAAEPKGKECGVSLWDLNTNAVTPIIKTNGWVNEGGYVDPPTFAVIDNGAAPVIMHIPGLMQMMQERAITPIVHSGGNSRTLATVRSVMPTDAIAASTKLGLAFFVQNYGARIAALDLQDGTIAGTLTPPRGLSFYGELAYCEGTSWLAATTREGPILIRDVANKEWIGALRVPGEHEALRIGFSGDGKKLIARVDRDLSSSRATGLAKEEGLVWDLSGLMAGGEKK